MLLVEKSAYAKVLSDLRLPKGTQERTKADKTYPLAHGSARGGSNKNDAVPTAIQPSLDLDAADEGLLAFVQSTTCRRRVWAEAFDIEPNRIGTYL